MDAFMRSLVGASVWEPAVRVASLAVVGLMAWALDESRWRKRRQQVPADDSNMVSAEEEKEAVGREDAQMDGGSDGGGGDGGDRASVQPSAAEPSREEVASPAPAAPAYERRPCTRRYPEWRPARTWFNNAHTQQRMVALREVQPLISSGGTEKITRTKESRAAASPAPTAPVWRGHARTTRLNTWSQRGVAPALSAARGARTPGAGRAANSARNAPLPIVSARQPASERLRTMRSPNARPAPTATARVRQESAASGSRPGSVSTSDTGRSGARAAARGGASAASASARYPGRKAMTKTVNKVETAAGEAMPAPTATARVRQQSAASESRPGSVSTSDTGRSGARAAARGEASAASASARCPGRKAMTKTTVVTKTVNKVETAAGEAMRVSKAAKAEAAAASKAAAASSPSTTATEKMQSAEAAMEESESRGATLAVSRVEAAAVRKSATAPKPSAVSLHEFGGAPTPPTAPQRAQNEGAAKATAAMAVAKEAAAMQVEARVGGLLPPAPASRGRGFCIGEAPSKAQRDVSLLNALPVEYGWLTPHIYVPTNGAQRGESGGVASAPAAAVAAAEEAAATQAAAAPVPSAELPVVPPASSFAIGTAPTRAQRHASLLNALPAKFGWLTPNIHVPTNGVQRVESGGVARAPAATVAMAEEAAATQAAAAPVPTNGVQRVESGGVARAPAAAVAAATQAAAAPVPTNGVQRGESGGVARAPAAAVAAAEEAAATQAAAAPASSAGLPIAPPASSFAIGAAPTRGQREGSFFTSPPGQHGWASSHIYL